MPNFPKSPYGGSTYGTPVEEKDKLLAGYAQPQAALPAGSMGGGESSAPVQNVQTTPTVNNDTSKPRYGTPEWDAWFNKNVNWAPTTSAKDPNTGVMTPAPPDPIKQIDTGSLNKDSPAMSQQAADNGNSNFEDFFKRNKTYASNYRADIRNRMGYGPEAVQGYTPPKPPEQTATSATINQNVNVGQAPTAPPAASTPPKPPDAGNPFTSGAQQPSTPGTPPVAGASGGRSSTHDGPGGTQPSQTKQALEDPPAVNAVATNVRVSVAGTKSPDLNTIQAGAEANKPNPLLAGFGDDQLQAELAGLPTGPTQAEQDEFKRLGARQDDLNALKSDNGQALLADIYKQNVSPMDASMFEAAGGRSDIGRYDKEFDGAQNRYRDAIQQKGDDIQKRKSDLEAELARHKTSQDVKGTTEAAPSSVTAPGAAPSTSEEGWKGFDDMMGTKDWKDDLHEISVTANPSTWLSQGIGEEHGDVPYAAGLFRDIFGGVSNHGEQDRGKQDVRLGFRRFAAHVRDDMLNNSPGMRALLAEHGITDVNTQEAQNAIIPAIDYVMREGFKHFSKDPETWKAFTGNFKNPGYMLGNLKTWMNENLLTLGPQISQILGNYFSMVTRDNKATGYKPPGSN